ncbi:uncharacterized protein METZ01_LOCUS44805 [marine metagenome]|jgi:predicted AlkP superfamily pyrophosphatase or phosphodiesterase|uniref:Sulfatase N-terminal domain-containing protein n=1 Tax=marine metagenome TaxID=408172 RepID=A0A381RKV6_9ZZZZ
MIRFLSIISVGVVIFSCDGNKGDWDDPRVILISIDGFRGDLFKEPEFPKQFPNLHRLATSGTYCNNVSSVFPSLTYPAHTSMITGEIPIKHGIINNNTFHPEINFLDWYWYQDSVYVESIIDKIKEKELVSLGISWPVTVGAPITWGLPEIKSTTDTISTVALVMKHDMPDHFIESAQLRGIINPKASTEGYSRDILLHKIFMDAFRRKRPHLSLYHMLQTDFAQHDHGKNSTEALDAFAFMDSLIGNIITFLDKEDLWSSTTLFITGDHGFRDVKKQLNVNRLFADQGWLEIVDKNTIKNWQVACLSTGGSAFVRIKDRDNRAFKKKVRLLLAKQSEFETLEKRHMNGQLLTSEETDFLLLANKNYAFSKSLDQPYMNNKPGGTHGGDPEQNYLKTGFIAYGRKIRPGTRLENMNITQIAPAVSDLLNLRLSCSAKTPAELIRSLD